MTIIVTFGKKEIKAVFTPARYTVYYDENGGDSVENTEATYDKIFDLPKPTRAGYTFDGWYLDGEKITLGKNLSSVNGDSLTLVAHWKQNKYVVKYNTEGGNEIPDTNATYDVEFDLPIPEKTGYTFVGWYFGDEEKTIGKNLTTTGSITLVARWDANKYTVEYDINGGIFSDGSENIYEATYDKSFNLPEASRSWYTFMGWFDENGDRVEIGKNLVTESDGSIKLTAVWELKTYEIIYVYEDEHGVKHEVGKAEFDITSTSYTQPAVPVIKGYKGNWDFSVMPKGDEAQEPGNREVKANYVPIMYSITFYNGKDVYKEVTYTVETLANISDYISVTPDTEPAMYGYEFAGWAGWNADVLEGIKENLGSLDVFAEYNAVSYTLIFVDGEILVDEIEFTLNDKSITLPELTKIEGYESKWNISRDFVMQEIEADKTEITIEAVHIPIVYTITVKINGQIYEYPYTVEALEGEKIVVVSPELPEGYKFFSESAIEYNEERREITVTVNPLHNVLIEAKSDSIDSAYTVIFDYGNGNTESGIYGVGESITLPEAPTKAGYIFDGWYVGETKVTGENIAEILAAESGDTKTVTAKWTAIKYSITLDANSGELGEGIEPTIADIAYGETVSLPVPSRIGYMFLGYKYADKLYSGEVNGLATENGENIVLVAQWQAISYNVVFDTDGANETVKNTYAVYDAKVNLPYSITKTGYKFSGWKLGDTVYTGNSATNLTSTEGDTVTLTAVWTPITYTVIYANSDLPNEVMTYGEEHVFPIALRSSSVLNYWKYTLNGEGKTAVVNASMPDLSAVDGSFVIVTAVWTEIPTYGASMTFGAETVYFKSTDIYTGEPLPAYKDGYVTGWNPYVLKNGAVTTLAEGLISENWIAVVYTYPGGEKAYRIYQNYTEGADLSSIAPALYEKDKYTVEWVYTLNSETGVLEATVKETENTEYNVTFNTGCLIEIETENVIFGEKIILPVLSRVGYNFIGWQCGDVTFEAGKAVDVNESRDSTVDLIAVWELIEYTISYYGTDVTATYTVETLIKDIVRPSNDVILSRAGYVGEWVIKNLTYGDIVIHPTYTPIEYTLSFDLGGGYGVFGDKEVYYESEVILGVPTREGYRFIGWKYGDTIYSGSSPIGMTLATENGAKVTLTAVWSNTYTATFVANGEIVGTVEFTDADVAVGYIVAPSVPEKLHYNASWESYVLSASDIVIEAEYVPVLYSIKYYSEGVLVDIVYYTVETESIVAPTPIEKIGYIATWEVFGKEIGDKTVNTVYTPIQYTVEYNTNSENSLDNFVATYDEEFELSVPTRPGYEFIGWYLGEELVTVGKNLTAAAEKVTLSAEWKAITYQLNFETVDGEKTVDYTVESSIDELKELFPNESLIPNISGYSAVWEIPEKLVAGGMSINPVYTEIIYTVIFKDEIFNIPYPSKNWTVTSGSIEEYTVNGYEWKAKVEGEYVDYKLSPENFDKNSLELVLYLVHAEVGANKVEFKADGNVVTTKYYTEGTKIYIPEVPKKIGYIGEWDIYTNESFISLVDYNAEERSITIKADVHVDMVVEAAYVPIIYTVVYDSNGGIEVDNLTATYDVTYDLPVVTRVGYTFDGWYLSEDFEVKIESILNLTDIKDKVVTLYAKWTPITYTIRYLSEGLENKVVEVKYDEIHLALEVYETKAFHKFAGWAVGENVYQVGDEIVSLASEQGAIVELIAKYDPEEYTVTFVANGETVKEVKYLYGDKALSEVPKVPEKAYYTGTWEAYELSTSDITVNAVYKAIEYSVVFIADGNEVGKFTYTVESTEIAVPEVPEKQGYVGAWKSYTLDGGDKEVNAEYTAIEYTVYFYDSEGGVLLGTSVYTDKNKNLDIPPVPLGYAAWNIPELTYGDVNVYPTEKTVHVVTFLDGDGNVVAKIFVEYGNSLNAIPNVPKISGYTEKWESIPEKVEADAVIRPVYTPIVYTVTFYDSLGEYYSETTYTVVDRNISIPEVPERFANDVHYTKTWGMPELTYGNFDVHPIYTPKVYKVSFYAEGVLVFERTYTVENTKIIIPTVPHKEGYDDALVSWNQTDYNLNTLEKYLTDIRIDAVYDSYYIDVDSNGSPEIVDRFHGSASSGFTAPDAISRTGYIFGGWQAENGDIYAAGEKVEKNLSEGDSDVTLTAIWTAIKYTVQYQVIYEDGTVDTVETYTATYDVEFSIYSYSRTGYIISNAWNNSTYGSYGHEVKVKNLTSTNEETIVFEVNANRISYTINYYDRNKSKIGSDTVYYDTAYTTASHSETGYTFNYWKDANGNKLFGGSTTVNQNLTSTNGEIIKVYADMTILRYTITLSAGTGSTLTITVGNNSWTTSQTFDYGTSYTISVTANDGYQNASCSPATGTYTLTSNVTYTSTADKKSSGGGGICLVEGTKILMADGTYKNVEELVRGDQLIVFNHETGNIDIAELMFNVFVNKPADTWNVINMTFDNGTILRIGDKHGLFNKTLNKYVYVTEENAKDFIGDDFYFVSEKDGDISGEYTKLVDVSITQEYIRACSPITSGHLNCFAEGILTVTAFPNDIEGFVNIFEYDENMKYAENKKQKDIEKYGLFDYEDFAEFIPFEIFKTFSTQYLKVSIGKGYITQEEIKLLIDFLKEECGI